MNCTLTNRNKHHVTDMVCEVDLMRTQNVRTLNGLRRRLKMPMTKGERMKFLCHLQELLGSEIEVPVVKEVSSRKLWKYTVIH